MTDTITIERSHCAYIVRGGDYGDGDGTLVQTDWDYPGVAQSLGWSLTRVQKDPRGKLFVMRRNPRAKGWCEHNNTDGTIKCNSCGVTAGEFICAAGEYLDSKC